MTVSQLAENLELKKLSNGDENEINSCYIADLLSRVLGGCNSNDVWITVQTSLNMVAVAVMADISCVILPEGITAPVNVILKANDEGLPIYSSNKSAYELALMIGELL
ncbi:MAG: AraC family transcriptional regulator [Oscillospiraceae bacterium]|nr:AraC family transcriptional regulator [Oscillospiraceae bacterium]